MATPANNPAANLSVPTDATALVAHLANLRAVTPAIDDVATALSWAAHRARDAALDAERAGDCTVGHYRGAERVTLTPRAAERHSIEVQYHHGRTLPRGDFRWGPKPERGDLQPLARTRYAEGEFIFAASDVLGGLNSANPLDLFDDESRASGDPPSRTPAGIDRDQLRDRPERVSDDDDAPPSKPPRGNRKPPKSELPPAAKLIDASEAFDRGGMTRKKYIATVASSVNTLGMGTAWVATNADRPRGHQLDPADDPRLARLKPEERARRIREASSTTCPVCRGGPLSRHAYCLRCDRWGMDPKPSADRRPR